MEEYNVTNIMDVIEKDVSLAPYAYTRAGGRADYLTTPRSQDELLAAINWANEQKLPVTIFGRLSNLVVRDGGIRGLVVITTGLRKVSIEGTTIIAEAGASIIDVAELAYEAGLTGLEWSAGIPGSIGGALFMNAGAYGGQVDQVAIGATALNQAGQVVDYQQSDLDLGYRHSVFQDDHTTILTARFELQKGDPKTIRQQMDDFNYRRASKQPLDYPSNGSVFKRPPGYFAGKLIMDAGLQGYTFGGAQVSKKHAGFIVNVNHATGSDYEQVIHHVQETVAEKFGVKLDTEVRIVGEADSQERHN